MAVLGGGVSVAEIHKDKTPHTNYGGQNDPIHVKEVREPI